MIYCTQGSMCPCIEALLTLQAATLLLSLLFCHFWFTTVSRVVSCSVAQAAMAYELLLDLVAMIHQSIYRVKLPLQMVGASVLKRKGTGLSSSASSSKFFITNVFYLILSCSALLLQMFIIKKHTIRMPHFL